VYRYLAVAVDETNDRLMVVYCPDDDKNAIYVRQEDEFYRDFEEIE
jgi:hypothetical protein